MMMNDENIDLLEMTGYYSKKSINTYSSTKSINFKIIYTINLQKTESAN